MQKRLYAVLLCLALGASAAPADGLYAHRHAAATTLAILLTPQAGRIALPGGIAVLDLPAGFRYLDPPDAAHLLEAWGNPPGAASLGMIVPAGANPMAPDSWGVVLTYDKDGHKLYGLKELQSADEDRHALNDRIRVPGREGVLVLDAVAGIGQRDHARAGLQQVAAVTQFTDGNRYADADADSRSGKVADYGIAVLAAGVVGSAAWTFIRRRQKAGLRD